MELLNCSNWLGAEMPVGASNDRTRITAVQDMILVQKPEWPLLLAPVQMVTGRFRFC